MKALTSAWPVSQIICAVQSPVKRDFQCRSPAMAITMTLILAGCGGGGGGTSPGANVSPKVATVSGWDGSSYSGPRVAAPFAIMDVIYQAQNMVWAEDAAIVVPPLDVNWSPKNSNLPRLPFDATFSNIGSSSYINASQASARNLKEALYILGAADVYTDKYDSHVIAYEWAHYFEKNFSRSDNSGGEHEIRVDLLDPLLAFGEGYGYALAGIILKLEVPAQSGAIDALARAENIGVFGYNEFESVDANGSPDIYDDIPQGGLITLDTSDTFGPINADSRGGNEILNRRFVCSLHGCKRWLIFSDLHAGSASKR